jgi:hypothetical protein
VRLHAAALLSILALGTTGCPAFLSDDWRIASADGSLIDASDAGVAEAATADADTTLADASDAGTVGDVTLGPDTNASTAPDGSPDSIWLSDALGDTSTDDANCGAVGYACVHGRHCSAGRCVPAWLPMTTVNAPTPRGTPGAVIDHKLIIAGGSAGGVPGLATAAAYDSDVDGWTALPDLNNARCAHTLVSSGSFVYAFGGLSDCGNGATQIGTLEQWKPGDANWTVVSGSGTPAARYAHVSIWTGSGLLVYGGSVGSASYVATGAVYDPNKNIWADASCALTGCERDSSPMVVDQGYVRLWGGVGGNAPSGLKYEIATRVWSAWTPDANFPTSLGNPADDGRRIYFPSGGGATNLDVVVYDRQTKSQSKDTAPSPSNLSASGSIGWTGTEVILWGPTAAGGRYQPPAP